jgi:hypothetical protein
LSRCPAVDAGTDGAGPDGGSCFGCVAGGPYNYVFASSQTYVPGALGGLAGGDAKCNALAQAAQLPGTFVAWLSTATMDARARLGAARGWIRPDGRPFVDTVSSLAGGAIFYPPRIDERGLDLIHETVILVATGTDPSGTSDTANAGDWTSTADACLRGFLTGTTEQWTRASTDGADLPSRLYCFGTNQQRALTVPKTTGRIAFLSKTLFVPSGMPAADALCQKDAIDNGLPGSYRALLATQTSSAASRFDLTGFPWVRIDGVPWVLKASDLADGNLLTALNVNAAGDYQTGIRAWTGAADVATPAAVPSQNCDDWRSQSQTGRLGAEEMSDSHFFFWDVISENKSCTVGRALYCLQE